MASRLAPLISPRAVTTVGICALLTILAAPVQAQSYMDRNRGPDFRPGAEDARRGASDLTDRRAQEAARQAQEAAARARAAEARERAMKQRTDDLSRPLR
jgi:hypothetical protein